MRDQSSLTGDTGLDQLIPAAAQLAGAVHDHVDTEGITAALSAAIATAGDELAALRGLVLILGAMVPVDRAPEDLLGWLRASNEYRRLRTVGVAPRIAAQLAGVAA